MNFEDKLMSSVDRQIDDQIDEMYGQMDETCQCSCCDVTQPNHFWMIPVHPKLDVLVCSYECAEVWNEQNWEIVDELNEFLADELKEQLIEVV